MAEIILNDAAELRHGKNPVEIEVCSSKIIGRIGGSSRINNATVILKTENVAGSGFEVGANGNGGNGFEIGAENLNGGSSRINNATVILKTENVAGSGFEVGAGVNGGNGFEVGAGVNGGNGFEVGAENLNGGSSRINNATVILKTENVAGNGVEVGAGVNGGNGFEVGANVNGGSFRIIDYICPKIGDKVYINITEELNGIIKRLDGKCVIRIEGDIEFVSDIDIKIEYLSERIMHGSNEYFDADAGRAGGGKINLATGGLCFVHNDGNGISHVYNSWQAGESGAIFDGELTADGEEKKYEYGCGKGWKLNLHQYLVKRKGTDGEDVRTYIDGSGNYHEFTEKYYYFEEKQKIYIGKSAVSIGQDGKLTYDGKEVKTEQKSTSGLTLSAKPTDFEGLEKLELRHEDVAGLENEIEQLRDYKIELDYNKAAYGIQLAAFELQKEIEQDSYDLEMANQELNKAMQSHSRGPLRERSRALEEASQALQKASLVNGGGYNSESVYKQNYLDAQEALDRITYRHNVRNIGTPVEFKVAEDTVLSLDYTKYNDGISENDNPLYDDYIKAKAAYDNSIYKDTKAYSYSYSEYRSEIYNEAVKAKQENYTYRMREYEMLMLNKQKDMNAIQEVMLGIKEELIALDRTDFDVQEDELARLKGLILANQNAISELNKEVGFDKKEKERIVYSVKKTEKDIKQAEKNLGIKEFELKRIKTQVPESYISGKDGNVLCFNGSGRLVAVADAYENVMYIVYEDGKISGLQDSEGKTSVLEYEGGVLARIIGTDEKIVEFGYCDGGLSRITYADGTYSEYGYNEGTGLLETAVNPALYGVRLEYNESRKVQKVEETTRTYDISDNGLRELERAETRLLAAIKYKPHLSTGVTDRQGKSTTYIFDIFGKPVTIYEGEYADPGEKTKSVSIDYKDAGKAFTITENILMENLMDGAAAASDTLTGGAWERRQRVYDFDIGKLPAGETDFVLSAWAKGDSAYIADERSTAYSASKVSGGEEETDEKKIGRKYGLCAELSYDDGTTEAFSASYDWLNTEWQYLALPVTIREEDETGDRLTGRFSFILGGERRNLTGLKIILDYSYNTNGVEYGCVALRQGSWTYNEFDGEGKTVYAEDEKGNKVDYIYDVKGNMIKAIQRDGKGREFIGEYEYNKKNELIRSRDYRGLVEETVFDDKGRAVKSITYNVADPTSKYYNESVRDEKGKVIAEVDITGEFRGAEYEYDRNGEVKVVKDAYGNKTAYGYRNGETVGISGSCEGEESVNIQRTTLGFVTKVRSGGAEYGYVYDGLGRRKEVSVSGEKYSTAEYIDDYTTKVSLASGESFTDKRHKGSEKFIMPDGKEIEAEIDRMYYGSEEDTVTVYEKESGLLTLAIDKSGEKIYTTKYNYDKKGRVISKIEDGVGTVEQDLEYEGNGGIKSNRYEINGAVQEYAFEYDGAEGRTVRIDMPGGVTQAAEYDGLGRLTGVKQGEKYSKEIYYVKYGDHATDYVSSVWHVINGKRTENTRYAYDKKGNITSIRENGKETVRYEYDGLNRLSREDNAVLNKSETYRYDSNGNITVKTKYAYTLLPT